MTVFDAIMIIEDGDSDEEELVEAWQLLHDSRVAYQLQGWYGRQAQHLLAEGIIK